MRTGIAVDIPVVVHNSFNDPCIISTTVVGQNGDEGTWSRVWRLIFNIFLRTQSKAQRNVAHQQVNVSVSLKHCCRVGWFARSTLLPSDWYFTARSCLQREGFITHAKVP